MTSKNLFKKLSVLALVFVMVFAFAACENTGTGSDDTNTVESVETVEYTAAVGTSSEDVIAALPTTVTVTYADSTTEEAAVGWEAPEDYDSTTEGSYTFNGTVTLSSGDTAETTATVYLGVDSGVAPEFKSASVEDEVSDLVLVEFDKVMDFADLGELDYEYDLLMSIETDVGFTIEVNGVEVSTNGVVPVPDNFQALVDDYEDFWSQIDSENYNLDKYIDGDYFVDEDEDIYIEVYGSYEYFDEDDIFYNYVAKNYAGNTSTVGFYLAGRVEEGDVVTISYDASATGATAADIFGNELQSFQDENVVNNVTAPEIVGGMVENDSPNYITLEFDEDMEGNWTTFGYDSAVSDYKLTISYGDNEDVPLRHFQWVEQRSVEAQISPSDDPKVAIYYIDGPAVKSGQTVTVSYAPDGGSGIYLDDKYNNELAETTDFEVTNDTFAPEFVDAYIGVADTEATTSNTITVEANEVVSVGPLGVLVLADNGFIVRDDAGDLVELVEGGVTASDKYVSVELAEAVTSSATGYEVTYDPEAAEDKIVDKSLEEVPGVTLGVTNNLDQEEEVPLTLDTAEATTVNAIELTFGGELPAYTEADLKDAITLTYNGTEITNYAVEDINADPIVLSLNGVLDLDYATGDATIAIEDTEADISIPETDVVDGIAPALVEEGITAVDNNTMTFEFTEPVSALDFKTLVDSADLELTNSTITGDGTTTLTVALDSGFELPDGQFDTVDVLADAVEDAAGNANEDEYGVAVVDEIAPEFTDIEVTVNSTTESSIVLSYSEDVVTNAAIGVDDFDVIAGGLSVDFTVVDLYNITINDEVTTDSTVTVYITSPEKVEDTNSNLLIAPFEQEDTEIAE